MKTILQQNIENPNLVNVNRVIQFVFVILVIEKFAILLSRKSQWQVDIVARAENKKKSSVGVLRERGCGKKKNQINITIKIGG